MFCSSSAAAHLLPEGYFHKIVDHTLDDLLERLEVGRVLGGGMARCVVSCQPVLGGRCWEYGSAVVSSMHRSSELETYTATEIVGASAGEPAYVRPFTFRHPPLVALLPGLQYFVDELDIVDGDVEYSVRHWLGACCWQTARASLGGVRHSAGVRV